MMMGLREDMQKAIEKLQQTEMPVNEIWVVRRLETGGPVAMRPKGLGMLGAPERVLLIAKDDLPDDMESPVNGYDVTFWQGIPVRYVGGFWQENPFIELEARP